MFGSIFDSIWAMLESFDFAADCLDILEAALGITFVGVVAKFALGVQAISGFCKAFSASGFIYRFVESSFKNGGFCRKAFCFGALFFGAIAIIAAALAIVFGVVWFVVVF